jgi:methyltransferase-like protein
LQFVTEADPADVFPAKLTRPAYQLIDRLAEGNDRDDAHARRVRREQAADLVRGRRFRQSLLARRSAPIAPSVDPARLDPLFFAGKITATAEPPSGAPAGTTTFRGEGGGTVTINHPAAASALRIIGEAWPAAVRFDDLRRRSAETGNLANDAKYASLLSETILATTGARLLEIHAAPPPTAASAGQRPRASALARWQASRGEMITTLAGRSLRLQGNLARTLLQLLDGTRTRDELSSALAAQLANPSQRDAPAMRAELDQKLAALAEMRVLQE